MSQSFDPQKIEAIFGLVSKTKENVRDGALNAAMSNLAQALEYYIQTPMLRKEREILEVDFYDLIIKISEHPKFAGIYGPVSFRAGEHKMNLDFLRQLVNVGADNIRELIEQGLELLENESYKGAWKVFVEVMNNPDADVQDFLKIGDAYLKKKMWTEAQEVFQRAMEKDPDSLHILNRMAISLRKNGKFEEALSIYRKALMLSPRDEGLYYNVARLFLDMGKPKSAGQALRKSLAINPKFEPAAKLMTGVMEGLASPREKLEPQDPPAAKEPELPAENT